MKIEWGCDKDGRCVFLSFGKEKWKCKKYRTKLPNRTACPQCVVNRIENNINDFIDRLYFAVEENDNAVKILKTFEYFLATGRYYEEFPPEKTPPFTDEEREDVRRVLEEAAAKGEINLADFEEKRRTE